MRQAASAMVRQVFRCKEDIPTTSPRRINNPTEATKKSAHNLKTLHKIEVRDVSEGLISNRMTRILRNPYYDRTLSVNVFQLLKYFNVQTALDELRTAILLTIDDILFDSNFVVSNGDFLREALLDSSLVDLPTAIQGASPMLPAAYLKQSIHKMSPPPIAVISHSPPLGQ